MNEYDDIINLSRFEPKNHIRMSIYNRAAQFAPFAALTGFSDSIYELTRVVDDMVYVSDELKDIIDMKLRLICMYNNLEVEVKYFLKDNCKNGGKILTKKGYIKKIDNINKLIYFMDNTSISIYNLIDIII